MYCFYYTDFTAASLIQTDVFHRYNWYVVCRVIVKKPETGQLTWQRKHAQYVIGPWTPQGQWTSQRRATYTEVCVVRLGGGGGGEHPDARRDRLSRSEELSDPNFGLLTLVMFLEFVSVSDWVGEAGRGGCGCFSRLTWVLAMFSSVGMMGMWVMSHSRLLTDRNFMVTLSDSR